MGSPRLAQVRRKFPERGGAIGVGLEEQVNIRSIAMSTTGLDVFGKSVQTTNIWLDEIVRDIGPDRHVAWHVLGAVLRALRDRLPIGVAAHLGALLPLLVRGAFYAEWKPGEPLKLRSAEEFLEHVAQGLAGTRPVNARKAASAVFRVLNHYVDPNEIAHVREALPENIRALWVTHAAETEKAPAA